MLRRAKFCCEWCQARDRRPHPRTGSVVHLAVAHIDRNRANNRFWNLAALCERCHLAHDVPQHVYSRFAGRQWYIDQQFLDLEPGELARAVEQGRAVLLPTWRQVVRRRRLVRPVQRLPRPQLPLPYTPPVLLTVPALTSAELAHRQRLLLQQALASTR